MQYMYSYWYHKYRLYLVPSVPLVHHTNVHSIPCMTYISSTCFKHVSIMPKIPSLPLSKWNKLCSVYMEFHGPVPFLQPMNVLCHIIQVLLFRKSFSCFMWLQHNIIITVS